MPQPTSGIPPSKSYLSEYTQPAPDTKSLHAISRSPTVQPAVSWHVSLPHAICGPSLYPPRSQFHLANLIDRIFISDGRPTGCPPLQQPPPATLNPSGERRKAYGTFRCHGSPGYAHPAREAALTTRIGQSISAVRSSLQGASRSSVHMKSGDVTTGGMK